MSIDTVIEAELPTIAYEHAGPEEAHKLIRQAQRAVYEDPDRFDISREDAPAILNFGGGIHYCLGAHLARIELAEALTTMSRRMPNMRSTGRVPWKSITGIGGPSSPPVEFTTRP